MDETVGLMLSAVAGIIDRNGGNRVVVGPRENMVFHRAPGERMFIVPDLEVQEPVTINSPVMVNMMGRVDAHVKSELSKACGSCSVCCVTPYLKASEFTKPSHTACQNLSTCGGCAIYDKRPVECRVFECLWLKSQFSDRPMKSALRPDKSGVLLTHDTTNNDPDLIEVHVPPDKPDAAKRPAMRKFLAGKRTKRITFYYGENL